MKRHVFLGMSVVAATALMTVPVTAQELSPGLVPAMQRDLGLTEGQALHRIRQEAAIRAIDAERVAGAAYGGSWFDPAKGKLVIGVTDEKAASAVRAAGAEVARVSRTAAELDVAQGKVDAVARTRKAPDAVHSWHPDPRSGSVVVNVRAGVNTPEVDAFLAEARKAGPVTVRRTTAPQPKTYAAGTVGGDPYYVPVSGGYVRCSIGFSVHGGFVTAGHCAGAGANTQGWDWSAQGQFAGSSFPGNDYAFVRTGHGWWTVPVVLGWGAVSDVLVRGQWEAPVGSSICRSGSTTHWRCGQVLAKNETVNYGNGQLVHQLIKTSACAQGGDSGGSFVTGDQAQGMTSGGWGDCNSGGETWFQPLTEVLQVYGLQLHTA
ncbi:S1 family peptidase [Allokutzneria albata]|uniref:Alpha-lytic protease prodomain-containing protein n=1 Tax=Allokutzneria albata TaxID=211114 RepID=A0A1G9UXD2_ALLAB|nr:S1 family peptidase [Allokutzneria albata]SDM64634.1 Alpha-lytic protease prodomain-containing protein [Allokutzneria albata]